MLPKKRKFDLSKFDLDTSSPQGPSNASARITEAPVSSPASSSLAPTLPSASLFQIRGAASDPANLVSLPIFAAKGLPASGFLTPETVHEAFAGTFLRTSQQGGPAAAGRAANTTPRRYASFDSAVCMPSVLLSLCPSPARPPLEWT